MRKTILKEKLKLVTCAWLGLLCGLQMNPAVAQTNSVHNSIQIAWSGAEREFYSYTVSPAQTNQVEIRLTADGKSVGKRVAERSGGMDSLLKLAERASKEVAGKGNSGVVSKPESRRLLEITLPKEGGPQKFSVDGDMKELTQFFHSSVALKELLKLASEEQPKAYRLIDESGPKNAMMLPPNRR
jgi:DNA-binding helix-hairpin-helix protein with protein kinase domain